MPNFENLFHGRGKEQRLEEGKKLPSPPDPDVLDHAKDYVTPEDLVAAVNVSLTLGMPLLITGEPGSGKSSVAKRLQWELGLGDELLTHAVKSDTEARDLFYRFDTVGRFHAASTPTPSRGYPADSRRLFIPRRHRRPPPVLSRRAPDAVDPRRFIQFAALGRALLYAVGPEGVEELLGPQYGGAQQIAERKRCVVLIDEIDKAPRDVPNDILVEIQQMRFAIPELAGIHPQDARHPGAPVVELRSAEDKKHRPIVIFTSNSERPLPEPFIRRCVYHHLTLPPLTEPHVENGVTILKIVEQRFGKRHQFSKGLLPDAVDLFDKLREEAQQAREPARKPSLAELLDWLEALCLRWQGLAEDGSLTLARIYRDHPKALEESIGQLLLKGRDDRVQQRGAEVLRELVKQAAKG